MMLTTFLLKRTLFTFPKTCGSNIRFSYCTELFLGLSKIIHTIPRCTCNRVILFSWRNCYTLWLTIHCIGFTIISLLEKTLLYSLLKYWISGCVSAMTWLVVWLWNTCTFLGVARGTFKEFKLILIEIDNKFKLFIIIFNYWSWLFEWP